MILCCFVCFAFSLSHNPDQKKKSVGIFDWIKLKLWVNSGIMGIFVYSDLIHVHDITVLSMTLHSFCVDGPCTTPVTLILRQLVFPHIILNDVFLNTVIVWFCCFMEIK